MADSEFGYANSLAGICERVTTSLEDDQEGKENNKWSKEFLCALAADAFKMFAAVEPKLFAETVEFPLTMVAKGLHEVPEECGKLLSLDTIVDELGRNVSVQPASYDVLSKTSFFAITSPDCRGGKMRSPVAFSFARNPENSREFRISPKIPAGAKLIACATCSNVQKYIDDPDELITCEFARFIPAMHQWLMYVALVQVSGSEAVAEQHRIAFFDLIPYSLKDMKRAAGQVPR